MLFSQEYDPWRRLPVIVIIVSAGIYIPLLGFGFNLATDDYFFILKNPHVLDTSLKGLWAVLTKPGPYYGDIQPVAFLTLWVDHGIYGVAPWGYYLSQILLHALNVILTFLVVRKITGDQWLALLSALILGVHPLTVDTVGVISQRKTLLASLLGMSSMYFYVRWAETGKLYVYSLSLTLLVLSLLSKAHWICLPILLIVVDYYLYSRLTLDSLKSKIPFFFVSGVFALVTFFSVKAAGQVTPYHFGTLTSQLVMVLLIYTDYIVSFFVPVSLAPAYTYGPSDFHWDTILAALAIFLCWMGLLIICYRRNIKSVVFGIAWFTIGILPNAQIVPTLTVRADRYMYHALTGISIAAISVIFMLTPEGKKRSVALALLVITPIALGYITLGHLENYSSSEKYVQRFVDTQGWAPSAEIILGRVYSATGRYEKAVKSFQTVIENYDEPYKSKYRMQLAYVYVQMDQLENAIHQLKRVHSASPLKSKAQRVEMSLRKMIGR